MTKIMVRIGTMERENLAGAKAHLSEVVARVEAGDSIQISRRGKPVVQLKAIARMRRPISLAMLQAVTDTLPQRTKAAADVVRAMRDEARY